MNPPIVQDAHHRTQQLRLALIAERNGSDYRAVEGFAAGGIEIWTSSRGAQRFEIMIGGGGPTDWVEVSERDAVTYYSTAHRSRYGYGIADSVQMAQAQAAHWVDFVDAYLRTEEAF